MTTVPLRHVAEVRTSSVDKLSHDDERPVQLCNYVDVYRNDLVAPHADLMRATAAADEIARFGLQIGDSVLTKDSEDPNDIGISAHVIATAPDFVCGYHLAIARPVAGTHPRYLTWALRSRPVLDHFSTHASGISRYGLTTAGLRAAPIPWHPEETQRRIADFLDDRVARIDQIIIVRRQQADDVESATDAEWDALDSKVRSDAPSIPIRRVLRSITDGPFGSSLTSSHYTDAGARVIRLGNLGLAEFRDGDKAYISLDYAAELSVHRVEPGDLLMAGLGDERWPLGRSVVAPPDLGPAIVKADCYRIRLDSRISHEFAAGYLSGPESRSAFMQMARGSTRARLNTDLARAAELPLVDTEAQRAYTAALHSLKQRSRSAVAQLEESMMLLREYKQSLITSAVTGEIDVTTAGSGIPG